ncbi:unnamed protein product [Penicillium bialowiezense]
MLALDVHKQNQNPPGGGDLFPVPSRSLVMSLNVLFTILVALPAARAGGWDDFSNNLATDLAPFLSLFGEQITKQYLSESTTWVDYFIFAMAPMGILTGIVSAIRVCGTPSLRAFIGRAQEGAGNAEAELCTSTSRDVCELYNSGGIARVFGRPKILEVVHDPDHDFSTPDDTAGIYTFQEYVSLQRDIVWEKKSKSKEKNDAESKPAVTTPPPATFAPNLSLNIGIKKPYKGWFFLIAAIGLILQIGVLVFAGVTTYLLQWGNGDSPPETYACPLVISGTVLVCGGMFHCAFLIGQSTKEEVWTRKKEKDRVDKLSMYWVQPGGQIVGDQTFDAFLYTDHDNHLKKYMTSRKDIGYQASRSKLQIWAAIATTISGFVLQFTGLRGIHSSVSVAQLGVIMVMSIARASLRMQRLKPEHNCFAGFPDEVLGHELDWLVMRMGREIIDKDLDKDPPSYSGSTLVSSLSLSPSRSEYRQFWRIYDAIDAQKINLKHLPPSDRHNAATKLLAYRARLTSLTDSSALPSLARDFKSEMVEVRRQSQQLATMIEATLKTILSKAKIKEEWIANMKNGPGDKFPSIFWGMDCALSRQEFNNKGLGNQTSKSSKRHTVYLELAPKDAEVENSPWVLKNKRELEAILGLWTWSLKADPEIETKDSETGLTKSLAGDIQARRIVPAHQANQETGDLGMWLGKDIDIITEHSLIPTSDNPFDSGTLSYTASQAMDSSLWLKATDSTQTQPGNISSLWSAPIQGSLVSACAQEVFLSFFDSISDIVEDFGDVQIQETEGFRLENSLLTEIAQLFTEMQLGSRQEALICLLPLVIPRLRVPSKEGALAEAKTTATQYRRQKKWREAEGLLRWTWRTCTRPEPPVISANDGSEELDNLTEKAATALCELYRWALGDDSMKIFGQRGIAWIDEQTSSQSNSTRGIIERYVCVASKIMSDQVSEADDPVMDDPLTKTLLFITRPESTMDKAQKGEALCSAAKHGWEEVVLALLELGTDPAFKDTALMTPLSYAAQKGKFVVVRELLNYGSFPDSLDTQHRAPLSYASEVGFHTVTELLLKDVRVSPERTDTSGRSPLWWAAMRGHSVVVQQLLAASEANSLDLADKDGGTPLHWAAKEGNLSAVKMLLESGVAPSPKTMTGETPLHWAARWGHVSIVKLLLDSKATPDSRDQYDKTPSNWAAKQGHKDILELLLNNGAGPDVTDVDGETILRVAAVNGHDSVVKLLLDSGADPDLIPHYGAPILYAAAENGHVSVVKLLLDSGAALDLTGRNEATPLHAAASKGHISTVKLLLDGWFAPDVTDGFGQTALHRAAREGDISMAQLLLDSGATPDPTNKFDSTPLEYAATEGEASVAKLLLDRGANPDTMSTRDKTALHYAAENRNESVVKVLLDSGAAPDLKDDEGKSPLHLAAETGSSAIAGLLLQNAMVDPDAEDKKGRTPLWYAEQKKDTTTVNLIREAQDKRNMIP